MNPEMSPETTVLVDYANENLQLKIENARLRAELQNATAGNPARTCPHRRIREEACRGYSVLPPNTTAARAVSLGRVVWPFVSTSIDAERRAELREDIDREQADNTELRQALQDRDQTIAELAKHRCEASVTGKVEHHETA